MGCRVGIIQAWPDPRIDGGSGQVHMPKSFCIIMTSGGAGPGFHGSSGASKMKAE